MSPDSPPPLPRNSGAAGSQSTQRPIHEPPKRAGWVRRWFWSPVKQGENWAQTVFRVLGNLFRTAVTMAIVLNGIGFAALYVSYQIERRNDAKREAVREMEEAAKPINFVSVEIEWALSKSGNPFLEYACSAEYPFAISIHNNSDRAMTLSLIDLSIRKKGTTQLLRFRGRDSSGRLSENWFDGKETDTDFIDAIILPNTTYTYCRKFSPDLLLKYDPDADYIYTAEIGESTIFVEPEDWMYNELGVARAD